MISIAPMVDVTDRHFRYLCRLFTKKALLYTEMITAPAIIHGNRSNLLDFNSVEKPLVLQIAGSDENEISQAVKIAEDWNYDEINLNVGCPSIKVSEYNMGLSLMKDPYLVKKLVTAMKKSTSKKISVKHRIGVLEKNTELSSNEIYTRLKNYLSIVAETGITKFIIHARVGILGLDPKKNRSIPELDYDIVYRIKKEFPNLEIEINGGIRTHEDIFNHLEKVDFVMLGRVAYEDLMFLSKIDSIFQKKSDLLESRSIITRDEVVEKMVDYIIELEKNNLECHSILKHFHGLYYNERGSKKWKQFLGPPWENNMKASEILKKSYEKIKIK